MTKQDELDYIESLGVQPVDAAESITPTQQTKRQSEVQNELEYINLIDAQESYSQPKQPVAEPKPETDFSIQKLIQRPTMAVLGAVDAAASVASDVPAMISSGWAGIMSLPVLGGEQAGQMARDTREAMTYEPKMEIGKHFLGKVGETAEMVGGQAARMAEASGILKPLGIDDPRSISLGSIESAIGDPGFSAAKSLGAPDELAATIGAIGKTIPTAILEYFGLRGITKLRGKKGITGVPDSVQKSLDERGIKFDDLPDKRVAEVQTEVNKVLKENKARIDQFKEMDLDPTKAQATRNASDFQLQQELAKTDTPVRRQLEAQEATLAGKFDERVKGTQGQPVTSGSPVADTIIIRSTQLDEEIGGLYNLARDQAKGAKNIKLDGLGAMLRTRAKSDSATNGLINSVVGEMEAQGILDGFKVIGKVDVDTAERIRQFINSHFDSTTPLGRSMMRDMKNALDEDVFRNAGGDIFADARKAKAAYEKGLSRAKVSKFDQRKTNVVRDILENKLDINDLAEKVTQSKSYRAEDLQQLKSYLQQDASGKQSWNDLRAEILQTIKEKAFIGPEDATGIGTMSRPALDRIVGRIGESRMNILFDAAERKFLSRMEDLARLREPVRGTALGRGPTAQAVSALERIITTHPLISEVFKGLTESLTRGQRAKTALRLPPTEATVRSTLRGVPSAAAVAAPVLINQYQEE